jgi:hypothetical protein
MSKLEMTEKEQAQNFTSLNNLGQERGYLIEQNIDYGYGVMDTVWKIPIHPSLPEIKCGFVRLRSDEGGGRSQDWQDNQYSIRKIEEALMRGIRSGMDRVYLIADNEDMARSISGRIEWLSSFGSLIRFDALSLGLTPSQDRSSIIVPSQERVSSGEKIRKEEIRDREEQFNKHNRPKQDKPGKEGELEKVAREVQLDEHSRPKDQKKKDLLE